MSAQDAAIATFRALHTSGCFVIPNPWDAGSAKILRDLGFKALATTSAGLAFSRGVPDDVWSVPRDANLANIREIAEATPLPVNADFQSAYAHDVEGVATNVALCVETGAAGLSLEDATGNQAKPLYDQKTAVERLRAARAAIDGTGKPIVLTARCEAVLVGEPNGFRVAVDRLVAYASAGADCLFAPGIHKADQITTLVKAVAPKPVNVIVAGASAELSVARMADLGVRRISVGSALARVAWGAFMRAARSIAQTGDFESLGTAATFDELNRVFTATAAKR